jgi:hypothetical protein
MQKIVSNCNVRTEFIELTEDEIIQISGSAEATAVTQTNLYPEIENDPPG